MFGKNIKLKSSVEKSSTLVNGKVPWCGVDSCLWAWIISPSVDNSHDVKKLSWEWFNLIILGVPNSSRTFDLDLKSLPALIIINCHPDFRRKKCDFARISSFFKYINNISGFKNKKKNGGLLTSPNYLPHTFS